MNFGWSTSRPAIPSGLGVARGGFLTRSVATAAASALLVVTGVYLLAPVDGEPRRILGYAVLVAGPLTALVVFVAAARRAPRAVRASWLLFGAGALVMLLGGLLEAIQLTGWILPALARSPALGLLPFLHLCLVLGAVRALGPIRTRGAKLELALDGTLILAATAILVERLVFQEFLTSTPPSGIGALTVLLRQVVAGGALYATGLLVLRSDHLLPGLATPLLACAAALFLSADLLVLAGMAHDPRYPGGILDLVWLSGWGVLVGAGMIGVHARADYYRPPLAGTLRRRLRRAVVPGAALFLGVATVDAAVRPGAGSAFGTACVLMGLLLAARIAYAQQAAERSLEERRLLEQNRALVEVSHALAGATELSRTLELVTQLACRLLDAYAAGIELLDPDGGQLELRAIHGLPSHMLGLRFPVDGSFTGSVVHHGRPRATLDLNAEPFVRPESVASLGSFPIAAAPLQFRKRPLGALFAIRIDRPFDDADLELLGALADHAALAIQNAQLFEQVRTLSMTDPLTGLANRRQLEHDLEREFAAARRGRQLIAVLFDLDNFKVYNDRYGHLAGDEVLRAFGRALSTETRAMNLAVRYGGDEFLVILSGSTREGAGIFIDRVATRFDEELDRLGQGVVTVSAGLALFQPEMSSIEELIAEADRSLYRVKDVRPGRSIT